MATYTTSNSASLIENNVWGAVEPYPGSTAPTHEDTDCKGGYQCVANLAGRLGIPASKREFGMVVFQQDVETEYKLNSNLTSWSHVISQIPPMPPSLYVYTEKATWNSQYEYEEYKWHDGRLEIKMRRQMVSANTATGNIKTGMINSGVFPITRFIHTPISVVGSRDGAAGISWATIENVQASGYNLAPMSVGGGKVEPMVLFIGRWK